MIAIICRLFALRKTTTAVCHDGEELFKFKFPDLDKDHPFTFMISEALQAQKPDFKVRAGWGLWSDFVF